MILLLTLVLAFEFVACGTIIYPERRGQRAGEIDAGIVVLDAVGLLLFFIPGVIAFAVDFSTGAIYLPAGKRSMGDGSGKLVTIRVDPKGLTPERAAEIVRERTGMPVPMKAALMYRIASGDLGAVADILSTGTITDFTGIEAVGRTALAGS
jgi:hypothetical protein